jgi:hypothetical protein
LTASLHGAVAGKQYRSTHVGGEIAVSHRAPPRQSPSTTQRVGSAALSPE